MVSPPLSKALALVLLLGVASAACLGVGAPLIERSDRATRLLEQDLERLRRIERIVASADQLSVQEDNIRIQIETLSLFLPGETASIAAALLQRDLKTIVERHGGRVRSVGHTVDDQTGLTRLNIRTRMQISHAGLYAALAELEVMHPPIATTELRIRQSGQPDRLDVDLMVAGFQR